MHGFHWCCSLFFNSKLPMRNACRLKRYASQNHVGDMFVFPTGPHVVPSRLEDVGSPIPRILSTFPGRRAKDSKCPGSTEDEADAPGTFLERMEKGVILKVLLI